MTKMQIDTVVQAGSATRTIVGQNDRFQVIKEEKPGWGDYFEVVSKDDDRVIAGTTYADAALAWIK